MFLCTGECLAGSSSSDICNFLTEPCDGNSNRKDCSLPANMYQPKTLVNPIVTKAILDPQEEWFSGYHDLYTETFSTQCPLRSCTIEIKTPDLNSACATPAACGVSVISLTG